MGELTDQLVGLNTLIRIILLVIVAIVLVKFLVLLHFLSAHPGDRLRIYDFGSEILALLSINLSHDLEDWLSDQTLFYVEEIIILS